MCQCGESLQTLKLKELGSKNTMALFSAFVLTLCLNFAVSAAITESNKELTLDEIIKRSATLEKESKNMTIDQVIRQAEEESAATQPMHDQPNGRFFGFVNTKERPLFKVELDLMLTREQFEDHMEVSTPATRLRRKATLYRMKNKGAHSRMKRKALRDLADRWTNKMIPYEFDSQLSTYQKNRILEGIEHYKKYTCLNFRPATSSDRNKVRFELGSGCSSAAGMIGGTQTVNMNRQCYFSIGTIIHEIGHVIGFKHEHNRPDRDDYVEVVKDNIEDGYYLRNFKKYSSKYLNTYQILYDYRSVMHYGGNIFAKNILKYSLRTLNSRYQYIIGTAVGLSIKDMKLANKMYRCDDVCGYNRPSCPKEGFLDKNCKCMCPGYPLVECGTPAAAEVTTMKWYFVRKPYKKPRLHPDELCRDSYTRCDRYVKYGKCNDPFYSPRTACERTCGYCTGQVSPCADIDTRCKALKGDGHCLPDTTWDMRHYMRMNCNYTCDFCPSDTDVRAIIPDEGQGDEPEIKNVGAKQDSAKPSGAKVKNPGGSPSRQCRVCPSISVLAMVTSLCLLLYASLNKQL